MDFIRFRLIEQIGGIQFILAVNCNYPEQPGFRTRVLARMAKKKIVSKKKTKIVIERIEYWN